MPNRFGCKGIGKMSLSETLHSHQYSRVVNVAMAVAIWDTFYLLMQSPLFKEKPPEYSRTVQLIDREFSELQT